MSSSLLKLSSAYSDLMVNPSSELVILYKFYLLTDILFSSIILLISLSYLSFNIFVTVNSTSLTNNYYVWASSRKSSVKFCFLINRISYTDVPHVMAPFFIALCRYCIFINIEARPSPNKKIMNTEYSVYTEYSDDD